MRNNLIFDKVDSFTLTRDLKASGHYPFSREIISGQDTEVILKGNRKLLMLGSNSYMGLTNHPEIKAAAKKAVDKYGTGCAGSRFLNGTLDLHEELEVELAKWVGKEAAILFSTGFQANQGVIAPLLSRHDHIVLDKYDHASIVDGARLSMAKVSRYAHNDMKDLEQVLARIPKKTGLFIITEGIYSMDGDILKLPEVAALAERYGAALMVDDAHALGVLGKEGSGTASHFGLTDKVDIIMGTFSKSLASIGGFVGADQNTIEFLRHSSRAYMFSASMPPASAAATLSALKIIQREPERIARLWEVTHMMRNGLQAMGYNTRASETPVIPVYVGDALRLLHMTIRLDEEGVFVNPVYPPAVPPTDTLLRISLMATHTTEQIRFALEKMEKVGKEVGLL